MGCYNDGYESRCQDPVDAKANRIADRLDRGNTEGAASALQREMQNMNPREFRALISRTDAYERKDQGDNLVVNRNGDILIDGARGGLFKVGNLREQERCWQERQAQLQYQTIPDRPVIVERQPQPYYDPGYDRPVIVQRPQPYYEQPQFIPQPRYGQVYQDPGYYRRDPVNNILQGAAEGAIISGMSGGNIGKGAVTGIILNQVFRRGW